jgi:cyclin L
MGAIFLAGKMDEVPKKLRDVINVFYHLKQKRSGRALIPLDLSSDEYWKTKEQVLAQENAILRLLGYHLLVEHPHKFLINYFHILGLNSLENVKALRQRAWNYVNDSLRMWVCVRYAPEVIASAAM